MTLKQEIEELKKRVEILEQRPVIYPTYQPIYGPNPFPTILSQGSCPRCGAIYFGQTHQCYYGLGNQIQCHGGN